MLYLDNSATTPVHPEVIRIMTDVLEKHFGNPSSLHRKGVEAERLLTKSREVVAQTLEVEPEEIIFTSGGTEGDNLAIKGIALEYQNRGKHVITTKIEHPAVREACSQLEKLEFDVTYLDVNKEGFINIEELKKSIRKDTILVSVMQVNNEVGTIQPIQEIGEILRGYPKVFFHVDAVQGYGKVPIKIKEWGIDLLTISGHKIHGPKGVGALYVKKGTTLFPLLAGGGQEVGVRSGTENLPGIVGFAKACQIAREISDKKYDEIASLRHKLINKLTKEMPQVVINGPKGQGASPYILNLSIPGLRGEVLVHALEKEEIFVSTGSACSSKKEITSPVLTAMGLDPQVKKGSIRVSFSYNITEKETEDFVVKLKKSVEKLAKMG